MQPEGSAPRARQTGHQANPQIHAALTREGVSEALSNHLPKLRAWPQLANMHTGLMGLFAVLILFLFCSYSTVNSRWPKVSATGIQVASPLSAESESCSSSSSEEREVSHEAAVKHRHYILQTSPGGSAAAWDAEVPMDTQKAWDPPSVWDVYTPTYGCLRPSRIGGEAPRTWGWWQFPLEEKVVCNIHRLQAVDPCLVYSFGVGWDTSFEIAVLKIAPQCKVRVFDPTLPPEKFWELVQKQTMPGDAPPKPPHLTFDQVGVAGATAKEFTGSFLWNGVGNVSVTTLSDLMRSKGESGARLTILKMDVEGAEWDALPQIAADRTVDLVDQLLLEVHLRGCLTEASRHQRHTLGSVVEALERSGLRAFSLTPNLAPVARGNWPACAEYSFIRRDSIYATSDCSTAALDAQHMI
mmetsp:Transcript_42808/g.100364  ORF Transcript_42808/g.100364 Transcript_42808/m.100364 type:complete len:412 (-) Transcript_42808:82-1317(-)